MKRILIKSLLAGCAVVLTMFGTQSCSDDWDNHYDASSTVAYDGSLMSYIESNPEFSDFAEILKATGYDRELSASQVMTVLVPKNNSFDKQEWLEKIAEGKTQQVIDQFVKNHVSRYNESMNMEEREVPMLSKKNITFGTMTDAVIEGVPVSEMNITCKNGVIHVLDGYLPYQYNIYEYLAKDYEDNWDDYVARATVVNLDVTEEGETTEIQHESLYGYLSLMHVDSLIENRSVSRGVDENGERIWVDKFIQENNRLLSRTRTYLYREDSLYLTILPSFEAYEKRYEGIKGLFNFNVSYNSDQAVRDSLQRYYAHYYAMADLYYNLNENKMSDPQSQLYDNGMPVDTLFSTGYNRYDWPYDIYHEPFGVDGILSNYTEIVKCSNGYVYKMNEIPFSVFDNVFKKITLEAENTFYIYEDDANKFTNPRTTNITTQNKKEDADSIGGRGFVHIEATSNSNTLFTYYLPSTLSGEYDIFVKFIPLNVIDETKTMLPAQFRASLFERNNTSGAINPKASIDFYNPVDGKRNFQTDPLHNDSLYIGSYKFQYSYPSGTNPGALLQLSSYVLTSQAKTYTKEMLIDKIILVPSRTAHDNDGLYIERESKRR